MITSPDPAARASISRDPALGTPDFRLLEIGTAAAAPTVTLRRLYLQNGRVAGLVHPGGIPAAGAGGCILLRNGSLTIVDSVIEECTAVGIDNANGPACEAWGGAIAATAGSLTIRNSSFGFNTATGGSDLGRRPTGRQRRGRRDLRQRPDLAHHPGHLDQQQLRDRRRRHQPRRQRTGRRPDLLRHGGATLIRRRFSANAASGGVASSGTSGTGLGGGIAVESAPPSGDGQRVDRQRRQRRRQRGRPRGLCLRRRALRIGRARVDLVDTTVSDNRANGGSGSSGAFNGVGARRRPAPLRRPRPPPMASRSTPTRSPVPIPGAAGIIVLHENAPPRRS